MGNKSVFGRVQVCRFEDDYEPGKIAGTAPLLTRRQALAWIAGISAMLASGGMLAGANAYTVTDEDARDKALRAMRQADLSPSWFTSSNWDNSAYQPWTDYLVGKIPEIEFSRVCTNSSDYCLRDVWNLGKEEPNKIDWSSSTPFNWNGIHALAVRFYRTGDPVYLKKWLAVVEDYAVWSRNPHAPDNAQIKKGHPVALLQLAMAWGGIFTALAIVAKGLGATANRSGRGKASPYAPVAQELGPLELGIVPAEKIVRIARAFAEGHAVDLVRSYSRANYVPNQRMFGLETVAYLVAFFPGVEGVGQLAASLNSALLDVLTRYRLPDGGQLEQSFNYAEDLVFGVARMAKLPYRKAAWLDEASRVTNGWARMAAALESPVGGLPQVGNSVWGRHGRQQFDGKFAVTSIAFPYSGYYVMRSAWTPDAAYLFFFYRRAARGHSMAGCNSIQVAAYGRQLLIAGGSANYSGKSATFSRSPTYLAEESSFKTNTVIVDGRSQNGGAMQGLPRDVNGKADITVAPSMPVQSRWHSSANFDYVDGLYTEGYKSGLDGSNARLVAGVDHYRQVVFVRTLKLWVVVDAMRTNGSHRYTQIWKFAAPDNGLAIPGFTKHQVMLRPDRRIIQTEDTSMGAVNISLQQFGIETLAYRSFFGEGRYGYVGPGPLAETVPAVDVHAMWEGRGSQVLVTVITPYRGLVSPVEAAADAMAHDVTSCRLEMAGGAKLSVLVAATPRQLESGMLKIVDGELIIKLEQLGEATAGIVISSEASYEFVGEKHTPILVPNGFSWSIAGYGLLVPSYCAELSGRPVKPPGLGTPEL